MAFVLAKEAFTRRFTCVSLCVADTRCIHVSPMTEGDTNAYDLIAVPDDAAGPAESYEVYHLLKRGKQHVHAATVQASGPLHAMALTHKCAAGLRALNIWAVRTADIRFTREEEKDLWTTLPDKKFRDALDYRGGERLKQLRNS